MEKVLVLLEPEPEPELKNRGNSGRPFLDSLDWSDWVVFGGTVGLSLFIGFYFSCVQKQKTTAQLLLGGRNMSVFATTVSLLATFTSALFVLGMAGEMYSQGTLKGEMIFSILFFIPLSGFLFLPTLFHLKLTSVYEYLELRFDSREVRLLATLTFVVQTVIYLGIALYVPALTFKAMLDCDVGITIIVIGIIAGAVASAGGFKAVIWSDVFNITVMLAGMFGIIVQASIHLGGFFKIFTISKKYGRIEFFKMDADPFTNHSSLNVFFGMGFLFMSAFGCHPSRAQRYLGLSTIKRAYGTLLIAVPLMMIATILAVITGLAIFANYAGCDPLTLGFIDNVDDILPYFAVEHLSAIDGLVGFYLAFILTGSLTVVSSGVNSLAACTWEDFFKRTDYCKTMTEIEKGVATKILSFAFSLVVIGTGFLAMHLKTVLSAAIIVNGALSGPVLGAFILGVIVPFSNGTGVIVGMITGHVVTLWLAVGGFMYNNSNDTLPVSIERCVLGTLVRVDNISAILEGMMEPSCGTLQWPQKVYSLSYMLYPVVGTVVTVLVACIVSLLTGRTKLTMELEPYIHPWIVKCNWRLKIMKAEWNKPDWRTTTSGNNSDEDCSENNRNGKGNKNGRKRESEDSDYFSFYDHELYPPHHPSFSAQSHATADSMNIDGGGVL